MKKIANASATMFLLIAPEKVYRLPVITGLLVNGARELAAALLFRAFSRWPRLHVAFVLLIAGPKGAFLLDRLPSGGMIGHGAGMRNDARATGRTP